MHLELDMMGGYLMIPTCPLTIISILCRLHFIANVLKNELHVFTYTRTHIFFYVEPEINRPSICGFTLQMPTTTRTGPIQSWEPSIVAGLHHCYNIGGQRGRGFECGEGEILKPKKLYHEKKFF